MQNQLCVQMESTLRNNGNTSDTIDAYFSSFSYMKFIPFSNLKNILEGPPFFLLRIIGFLGHWNSISPFTVLSVISYIYNRALPTLKFNHRFAKFSRCFVWPRFILTNTTQLVLYPPTVWLRKCHSAESSFLRQGSLYFILIRVWCFHITQRRTKDKWNGYVRFQACGISPRKH